MDAFAATPAEAEPGGEIAEAIEGVFVSMAATMLFTILIDVSPALPKVYRVAAPNPIGVPVVRWQ